MKAVSGTQMRGLDRRTIEERGISGERLMQIAGLRAGAGILKQVVADIPGEAAPEFRILAGKGNPGAFFGHGMTIQGIYAKLPSVG